jgi:hypothetical protein
VKLTDVEHRVVDIDATRAHAYNQVNVRRLKSGDLVAVYNEERFPYHHDSGQTVLIRSRDEGETWTDRTVVLPYTAETGNWDCGICELDDGTLIIDLTIAAYFKRGIRPEQPSWRSTAFESEIFAHTRAREFSVESLAKLQESVLARWPRGPHTGAI